MLITRYFRSNKLRLHAMALLFYAALAFILLHSIIFTNGTHVAGYDFFNYNWNFWWIRHALTTPGLNIYENNFVMYPAMSNYGYHALTVFWYPLWAVIEPFWGTLTAVNVIIFTGCVLNGYLLFLLLLSEGVSPAFALIGGAALQTLPIARYFYYNTHLNLMDWFWVPAQILLWKQIVAAVLSRRLRRALLWAVIMGVALWGLLLTDLQFPIFVAVLLVPYGVWTLWLTWRAGTFRKMPVLIVVGFVPVIVGLALMWFAGPLSYIVRWQGRTTPSPVEERPGVPFPMGFLSISDTWWQWDTPTTGAFVTLVLVSAIVVRITEVSRTAKGKLNRQDAKFAKKFQFSEQKQRETNGQRFFHVDDIRAPRWCWFLVMLPPLVLAMGPSLHIGDSAIPLPFRWLYDLTTGNFRMPWRLAPDFVMAAMAFAGLTWTQWLTPPENTFEPPRRQVRQASTGCQEQEKELTTEAQRTQRNDEFSSGQREKPHPPTPSPLHREGEKSKTLVSSRNWARGIKGFVFAGVMLVLAVSVRLYETAPLQAMLYPYQFYEAMAREPYTDYVVLEVPTGAGTGEVLLGNMQAIQFQYYGMIHEHRMVNGFVSRAPLENFYYIHVDDPMLAWLGQRRLLEPEIVEQQLRERIFSYPIGYIVIHQDYIGRNTPTVQEIVGYFNTLPDLLCPYVVEGEAIVYRTAWHPDGCASRVPPEIEHGVYQVDIGTAGDEFFIGWGYHWQEQLPGTTLRWTGEYPQTQTYVDLPPGAYRLTVAMQAFWETRTVQILVNDVAVGEPFSVVTDVLNEYAVTIPADLIGDGQHVTVTLAYDAVIVPAEVGQSSDPRRLAVGVDWLRFESDE